jgi:hypothetical protein
MKKIFKPASLLLYALTIIVFFVGGFLIAALTGAGENQGLAGGAIVLFYGLVTAFAALIISIFAAYILKEKAVILLNKILIAICFVIAGYVAYKQITGDKKEPPEQKQIPTKPVTPAVIQFKTISHNEFVNHSQNIEVPMGIGFFKPNFFEKRVLYFYGNPNLEKSVIEHSPTDSVVFNQLEHGGFEITYAPPWLVPDHLKLDYEILYFRIQSISHDFIELTVNKFDQRIAYADRFAGKILYWQDFLLSVSSVEFIEPQKNKIYYKPFLHAGEVKVQYELMKPEVIKGSWMKVSLYNENYKRVGKGWIKWKEEEKLLITYSLLS